MTAPAPNRELFAALVEELAIVVGAMIDSGATVVPGAPAEGRQWVARIRAEGPLTGTITVALDHEGSTAITRLMTGIEGDIPDEVLLDTPREVFAQAVSALALKPVARGATLTVAEVVVAAGGQAPEEGSSTCGIGAEKLPAALVVTTWGSLAQPAAAPRAAAGSRPAVSDQPDATLDERIGVILDIDLPLVVRFGRTELPLRALTRLGPGSVIDLGRSPDDPVDVLVSNRVVARGEVVVVGGSYGIRILDVVSQRERVRSVEG
jgi:flagellar motor switch protein FliN/FliY